MLISKKQVDDFTVNSNKAKNKSNKAKVMPTPNEKIKTIQTKNYGAINTYNNSNQKVNIS